METIEQLADALNAARAALSAKLSSGARHADYEAELRAYNAADIAWTRAKIRQVDAERLERRQKAQAIMDRLTAGISRENARLLQEFVTLSVVGK